MATFSSKLPQTGVTIFTVMSQMAQAHQAINLSQGFPNFDGDARLIRWVEEGMQKGFNQYAPMAGLPALRTQIARWADHFYGVSLDPDQEITVTAGATEALMCSMLALIHPGDEVIVFEPAYDAYIPAIQLAGGTPIRIEMRPPDYAFDWEAVRQTISPQTKAILVNSPHNPSGTTWKEEDLEALKHIALAYDLIVISDEVYAHMVFDSARHHSVLNIPELADRRVVTYSFGKTLHHTGWKVGYALAPEWLTAEIRKVHQFVTFSVSTPFQYGIAQYLEHCLEDLEGLGGFFQRKRDLFLSLMEDTPFEPLPNQGTYFQTMRYDQLSDEPDHEFVKTLTKEAGVAAIPISAFYQEGTDHGVIRFCFAKDEATLEQAAIRLKKWRA
ncbi:MAG: methionine aminotransferase [Bacteroidota bacterium]